MKFQSTGSVTLSVHQGATLGTGRPSEVDGRVHGSRSGT
ncbi:hypothetical protein [Alloactinosynnema sp. L-07]|nr:hypothetical protein [Alloactinosynnema sp. L-07]